MAKNGVPKQQIQTVAAEQENPDENQNAQGYYQTPDKKRMKLSHPAENNENNSFMQNAPSTSFVGHSHIQHAHNCPKAAAYRQQQSGHHHHYHQQSSSLGGANNAGTNSSSTIMNGEKLVFNNITNNFYQLGGGAQGGKTSLASPPPSLGTNANQVSAPAPVVAEFKPFESQVPAPCHHHGCLHHGYEYGAGAPAPYYQKSYNPHLRGECWGSHAIVHKPHPHHYCCGDNHGHSLSLNPLSTINVGSPPDFNSGSGFKIKSGSKFFMGVSYIQNPSTHHGTGIGHHGVTTNAHHHHHHTRNHNSTLSTSKFLTNSAQFESKATFKTSYFGCLSNSSKKSGNGNAGEGCFNMGGVHQNSSNQRRGMLDISPILNKSVSCFDPIIANIDIAMGAVSFQPSFSSLLHPGAIGNSQNAIKESKPQKDGDNLQILSYKSADKQLKSQTSDSLKFNMGSLLGQVVNGTTLAFNQPGESPQENSPFKNADSLFKVVKDL